jgi:predicted secreted protein
MMNKSSLLWILIPCIPLLLSASCSRNLEVSLSSSSLTVLKGGDSKTINLTLKAEGFSEPVSLTTSTLPTGVSVRFDPELAQASSVVSVAASSSASVGVNPITIFATAGATSVQKTLTLTVQNTPNPEIVLFLATPSTLPAVGGSVQLEWNVLGATALRIDPDVGVVSPATQGKVQVNLTSSKTFTLTATNSSGTSTLSQDVTVGSLQNSPGTWDQSKWNQAIWQ